MHRASILGIKSFLALLPALIFTACMSGSNMSQTSLPLSDNINLQEFMGRWYVIANIPTFVERNAYNAVEEYAWQGDGKVATTFTYNEGALDGPFKKATPTGFVSDDDPAVWKMQFIWPIKADYRVMYVDDAHTVTVIGREKRDYVWLMARTPTLDEDTYNKLVQMIADNGYDISKLRRIPHDAGRTATTSDAA